MEFELAVFAVIISHIVYFGFFPLGADQVYIPYQEASFGLCGNHHVNDDKFRLSTIKFIGGF